jgi:hypothetical protein
MNANQDKIDTLKGILDDLGAFALAEIKAIEVRGTATNGDQIAIDALTEAGMNIFLAIATYGVMGEPDEGAEREVDENDPNKDF